MSRVAPDFQYLFNARRASDRDIRDQERHRDVVTADLQESLDREAALHAEISNLSQRQITMAQEFEHRLVNSLQIIASMLSLQSRVATTPDVAAQLTVAAQRVGAIGRVHRTLHILDHQDTVQFKPYVQSLCQDLSELLLPDNAGHEIVVQGENFEISARAAIPLGFIVNELTTNSAKHARSAVKVSLETTPAGQLSLSVLDDGPGLPSGFNVTKCKGLGMKIVVALVKQLHGELHIQPGGNGRGACFTVTFDAHVAQTSGRADTSEKS